MLFKVKREDIVHNLQSTVSIIEKKQTIPILSNVLVIADENCVVMTGTDLEIQLTTTTPAEVRRKGETTFSARKFYDICRNLNENSVLTVEIKDDNVHIKSDRTRFRLGTLNAENFPGFAQDTYHIDLQIASNKLLRLLQSTSFCMATQDVRYYLNGLMIEIDRSQIGAVASNGHRLAMYREQLDQPTDINTQIIIPRKGVMELLRLLDPDGSQMVRFKTSDSNVEIRIGTTFFLSKLIDGKYPDFKGALSQPISHSFVMNTSELKSALSRVSVLSHEKFRKINLKFSNNILLIRTDNSNNEEADEEIDIDYQGEDYEMNVNVSYLLDAVNNIGYETVDLAFNEKTDICLIGNKNDSKLNYVVMPLI